MSSLRGLLLLLASMSSGGVFLLASTSSRGLLLLHIHTHVRYSRQARVSYRQTLYASQPS